MPHESLNSVDRLISSGREALKQGRYDDAAAYIRMAAKKIRKQINDIGRTLEKIDESPKILANLAESLEKLKIRERSTASLLEIINKEKDRAKCFRQVVEGIRDTRIVSSISQQKEKLDIILNKPRTLDQQESYFLCLRKWNSYTPLVNTSDKPRQGGGYFLIWNGQGLVIDPGIGFLRKFFGSGFSISDIDAILLTHSHVDHTSDFEAILTLLQEVNTLRRGNGMNPHKPKIYLNIGAASKFMQLLSISYENVQKRILLDPGSTNDIFHGLSVTVCEAHHSDLYAPQGKCVGLLFKMEDEEKSFKLGITSDTGYSGKLRDIYSSLEDSILVLHLGSILEDELRLEGPTERVYPQHLGIRGFFNLVYDIHPRLAVISEIGEELQDCICLLTDNLNAVFPNTIILPADLGLKIDLSRFGDPIGIMCQNCKEIVNIKDITYSYDSDRQAIKYVCQECTSSESQT